MDKKKLEYFRKRLETRQKELRHMVTRNQQDGRIERFEVVLLDPSGELNGYITVHGSADERRAWKRTSPPSTPLTTGAYSFGRPVAATRFATDGRRA